MGKLGLEVAKAGTGDAVMPQLLKEPLKDKLFVRAKVEPFQWPDGSKPAKLPKEHVAVQDSLDPDSFERVMQFVLEYDISKRGAACTFDNKLRVKTNPRVFSPPAAAAIALSDQPRPHPDFGASRPQGDEQKIIINN